MGYNTNSPDWQITIILTEAIFWIDIILIFWVWREMKQVFRIMMSLGLLTMLFIVTATAANSQGLDWGLQSGDEYSFDYVVKDTDNETLVDEVVKFRVNTLPSIQSIVSAWNEIPEIYGEFPWANGTPWEEIAMPYFLYQIAARYALPLGN